MTRSRWARALDTPGKRVHVAIAVVGVLYLIAHVVVGAWLCGELLNDQSLLTAIMVTVTLVAAIGNVIVAAPLWVFAVIILARGPRPFVELPAPVSDEELPRILVQIPGRNEATSHVLDSIDSVLSADYPAERLTVQFVDNSDDDRWQEIARHYEHEPRVQVEHREGTRGFKAGNLNVGLQRLGPIPDPQNTLVGLLDVGDTFAPRVVRPMATEFVHDTRLGFVQDMFRIGNPRDTVITWSDAYVGDAARRFTEGAIAHYGIPTMNGHCAILRLAALQEIGGWDESRVAEDWNTGISMMMRGWSGKWVDYEPANPAMVSTELVPGEITAQQKQKRRWAAGGTELARLHLAEWMRSRLPWNQRFSLFLRFAANTSVLPGFVAQLMLPIWVILALTGAVSREVLSYGFFSVVVQSPFFLVTFAAAINHVRERNPAAAAQVVLSYPIQAVWRLPLFAHAGVGIAEGLHHGLKEFVITPKHGEGGSFLHILNAQRLVLVVSIGTLLPLLAAVVIWRGDQDPGWILALALPILTISALFLVPLTEYVRHTVLPLFRLPRAVYVEGRRQPWVPSGWMGNLDALSMNLESTVSPHSGKTCIEVHYDAPDGWAGIVWQHPANDWGDRPGGVDLTGARRLRFWARGATGGETVDFGVGLLGSGKLYRDSVRETLDQVVLEPEWREYTMDLSGRDLTRVKSGFLWRLEGQGRPVTFYLDDVRFE